MNKREEAENRMSLNEKYFKYSAFSASEKLWYYSSVKKMLRRLNIEYPDFYVWYDRLFQEDKELHSDREIIICEKEYHIAGVAILKSTKKEKKICTLRVIKPFQRQGIGRRLMEHSFEWLEDDKPLITMHKSKQYQFASLLDYYGFTLEEKQWNYYNIFSTELSYNGVLTKKDTLFNEQEIMSVSRWYWDYLDTGRYDLKEFIEECVQKLYLNEQKRRMQMIYE